MKKLDKNKIARLSRILKKSAPERLAKDDSQKDLESMDFGQLVNEYNRYAHGDIYSPEVGKRTYEIARRIETGALSDQDMEKLSELEKVPYDINNAVRKTNLRIPPHVADKLFDRSRNNESFLGHISHQKLHEYINSQNGIGHLELKKIFENPRVDETHLKEMIPKVNGTMSLFDISTHPKAAPEMFLDSKEPAAINRGLEMKIERGQDVDLKDAVRAGNSLSHTVANHPSITDEHVEALINAHHNPNHPKLSGVNLDGLTGEVNPFDFGPKQALARYRKNLTPAMINNATAVHVVDRKDLNPEHLQRLHDVAENLGWHENAGGKVLHYVTRNPNTPENILRSIYESDAPARHGLIHNPNLPTDVVQKIHEKNPSDDSLHHPNLPEHIFEQSIAEREDGLSVKLNTHRLRKLRDMIEEQGGVIHKKDAEKAGYNLSALGINNLPDAKGKLTAESIQGHIDSLPSMEFTHSSDVYGEEGGDDEGYDDWDNWDDDARHEAHDQEMERARDNYSMYDFVGDNRHNIFEKLPPEVQEGYHNYVRENHDPDHEDSLLYLDDFYKDHSEHFDDFLDEYENHLSDGIELNSPSDYDLSPEYYNGSEEGEHQHGLGEQRHSRELSDVFQLNLHPRQIKQMRKEGIYGTFEKLYNASLNSGHPVGENGVGWVRYTEGDDGIHIDEVQSDFGQSFVHQLKAAKKKAEDTNDTALKDRVNEYPTEHVERINQIVFGDNHPSQVLHDSFIQHLRNQGKQDKPVHIWHVDSKAPISGMKRDEPVPVHMKETYEKQPKKMGYEPSSYGKLETQSNPILQSPDGTVGSRGMEYSNKTFADKVRKSLGILKTLRKSQELKKSYTPSRMDILKKLLSVEPEVTVNWDESRSIDHHIGPKK